MSDALSAVIEAVRGVETSIQRHHAVLRQADQLTDEEVANLTQELRTADARLSAAEGLLKDKESKVQQVRAYICS